ncbi:hypothetical protein SUGI_1503770 [Cryptomeria japonica]|uniref:Uncharacterized protein n=1 Tax=Cryptomeria japonica TaxID=3369 RepID=A0AAD3NP38_CRYJA|nr:hypothetical protein SUGI_1503770 [Cryptomeria japonica]
MPTGWVENRLDSPDYRLSMPTILIYLRPDRVYGIGRGIIVHQLHRVAGKPYLYLVVRPPTIVIKGWGVAPTIERAPTIDSWGWAAERIEIGSPRSEKLHSINKQVETITVRFVQGEHATQGPTVQVGGARSHQPAFSSNEPFYIPQGGWDTMCSTGTNPPCLGHCRGFASDLLSHLEHELDPSSTRQISSTLSIFPPCMRPLKQAVGWTGGASREKPSILLLGTGRD